MAFYAKAKLIGQFIDVINPGSMSTAGYGTPVLTVLIDVVVSTSIVIQPWVTDDEEVAMIRSILHILEIPLRDTADYLRRFLVHQDELTGKCRRRQNEFDLAWR